MAGYREFQTGEVLTAANVNGFLMNQAVMVFADSAARTTALSGVLAEGMLTYNLDTQALEVYDGTDFVAVGGAMKEKRIAAFTGSGTWTVPAGVTYAIAHMLGGGGGAGTSDPSGSPTRGGDGGASSVAFASGTVSSLGGIGTTVYQNDQTSVPTAGQANSGQGAVISAGDFSSRSTGGDSGQGGAAQYVVAGAAVTPSASISVTVGAGGSAGTPNGAAGGSGYVYIEYYEEV